jgi:hypothetical protein
LSALFRGDAGLQIDAKFIDVLARGLVIRGLFPLEEADAEGGPFLKDEAVAPEIRQRDVDVAHFRHLILGKRAETKNTAFDIVPETDIAHRHRNAGPSRLSCVVYGPGAGIASKHLMNAAVGRPVLGPWSGGRGRHEFAFLFLDDRGERIPFFGLETAKSAGSGADQFGQTVELRRYFRDVRMDARLARRYFPLHVHGVPQTVFTGLLWNPNHAGWKRDKGGRSRFAEQKDFLRITFL